MIKLPAALLVGVGCLASSLTTAVGIASADPDVGPIINTTCSYSQVMGALEAQRPDLAQQFYSNPIAQAYLSSFLASPADRRAEMVQEVRASLPGEFTDPIMQVAGTCENY